jgi:hypothetical protein
MKPNARKLRRTPGCVREGYCARFLWVKNPQHHPRHCEVWAIARAAEIAAPTFAKELETMRGAFG